MVNVKLQSHSRSVKNGRARRVTSRNRKGAGLFEGVLAASLIVSVGVAFALVLLASGGAMLSQEKLAYVGQTAARFAAGHAQDTNLQSNTESVVKQLVSEIGMSPNQIVLELSTTSMNSAQVIQVKVIDRLQFGFDSPLFPNQTVVQAVANSAALQDE